MLLSDEKISKFQTLYKARFGAELSREEAAEQYMALIRLVQLTYRPITKKQHEEFLARRSSI